MIIHKIVINNFGPHQSTEVVLDQDITAIIGGNGNGKSFLVEAIPAVLFGEFPSRPGSIVDHVTQGYTGDALLSVEFSIDGETYIAERKIRKTAKGHTQDAFLFHMQNEDVLETLAGPKIKDFEDAVIELIGDPKIFFASAFSAQNNCGDIVECSPTDRKRILAELLNLSSFQEQSEAYSLKARELDVILQKADTERETLEGMKVETVGDIEAFLKANLVISDKITALTAEIQQINERKATLEAEYKNIVDIQNRKNKLDLQISEFEVAEIRTRRQIADLKELSLKVPELTDYQASRETIIKSNQEIAKYNDSVQQTINANNQIDMQISALDQEIRGIDYAISNAKDKLEVTRRNLEKSASLLSSGDYTSDKCNTCNFVSSAFRARAELDVLPLCADTSELESKKTAIEVAIRNHAQLKKAVPDFEKILDVPIDRSAELSNALVADKQMLILQEQAELNAKMLSNMELEFKDIVVPSDEKLKDEAIRVRARLTDIQSEINSLEQSRDNNNRMIATAEEQTKRNQEIDIKLWAIDKCNRENKHDYAIAKYIADFYGRKGIQALLIDNAIPQLQTISDELLQIATGGKMSIEFSTTKENKDGSQRESLEILCTDAMGTRDVSYFSGGEQKVLRNNIRLTLAIFQAQQSKKKIETLILDEPLDAMDIANSTATIAMLRSLDRYFKKVIFISHADELLADFPHRLELSKRNGVTVIN